MRLHEYEAKEIFKRYGIEVPQGKVVGTPEEAKEAARELGPSVVLKSQVLVGGRGLEGGVIVCDALDQVQVKARELFNRPIKGLLPKELLVERKVPTEKELYLGIAVDGYEGRPMLLMSKAGGVNVERLSREAPEELISYPLSLHKEFYLYQARELTRRLGFHGEILTAVSRVVHGLVHLFYDYEGLIAEINPLAITEQDVPVALDGVLEIDNSGIKRIKAALPNPLERIENRLERKGREIGVTYVDLDGDVGIISSGAGLGMASMDIIGSRLRPANFLETGVGITEELLYRCMELLSHKPGLRAILVNVYGGINPIHEGAKGIVRFIKERGLQIPIVAKALGNRQEETWEILKTGGVEVVTETATERAVERLCQILDHREGQRTC
jgi:succinyl-CoA synthetase beta subunit